MGRSAHEELPHEDNRQNDPHDAQRIGQCAAQRRAVGVEPQLLEGLLRGAECRGVGRRTAENARHVGHRDSEGVAHPHGQCRAQQRQSDGRQQQPHAVGAQRAEEAGADLQSEGVDEENQSEALGVDEHRGVEREAEVAGQNADEEDEGRAERDAADADFAQSDAEDRDERNHDDGLQRRVFDEQISEPFHALRICCLPQK